ncbi:amino acid permease [Ophiocordyceps camponoti-floridani]|uniref:Amino acid permease n=1 Tax=Ophiocordyceps camponoti-floridani TaxID=2030778 RepID=A0A8H4VGK6_9HYPO|nr:amino acid permease [Ophiocordyceps camponoti-floridani]
MDPNSSDEAQLAALGLRSELRRSFSTLSMLGLAFAVLNTWTAVSASLPVSLTSGGSTSIIWGLFAAGLCNLCIAASLAELLSAYPTCRGQYHWVAASTTISLIPDFTRSVLTVCLQVSWPSWMPLLSWINGWIAIAGWVRPLHIQISSPVTYILTRPPSQVALVATNALLSSQLIVGIVSLLRPSYEAQRWHQFLIYTALTMLSFLVNAFLNSLLPLIYRGAFAWSIGGFVVACVVMLACSSPDFHSADFVFGQFINRTGWPDGVAWLLGLLQGGLGVTAFDAVAHMIEEIPQASLQGPKIMMLCVIIGTVTGAIFLAVLLSVSGNMESVISSSAGPLLQILVNATGNAAGAVCLVMLPLVCLVFALLSVMTTSSRIIYAFARDGGLPASTVFARVHPKLGQPLNALALSSAVVVLFGLIFMASSSAFNAIMSSSVVALDLSYAMPIAIRCLRGRSRLVQGQWKLSPVLGWTVDVVSLAYITLTTFLFLLPPVRPVTGTNMNYCVVAFAVVIVVSVLQWLVDGRKKFVGPRLGGFDSAEERHEPSEKEEKK